MSPTAPDAWRFHLHKTMLMLVQHTRANIPSPGSANPNHRADDMLRDVLEAAMSEHEQEQLEERRRNHNVTSITSRRPAHPLEGT